jgi:hypothetical protein
VLAEEVEELAFSARGVPDGPEDLPLLALAELRN